VQSKVVISSPFGPVGIVWRDDGSAPLITYILLSKEGEPADGRIVSLFPELKAGSCAVIDETAERIGRFLEGEDVKFSLDVLDMEICSPFQRRVLVAEYGIPRGMVSTYGLIARHVGREGGARAVGNALAANPFPFVIPCHRAVRSDGSLGGYQGGGAMKRRLLENEGVSFRRNGKVDAAVFHYGQSEFKEAR